LIPICQTLQGSRKATGLGTVTQSFVFLGHDLGG